MTAGRAPWLVLAVMLVLLGIVGLAPERPCAPGLWADEIFSLAMAAP